MFPMTEEEKWRAAQNSGNVSMVNQSSMTPEQRAVLRERAAFDPKSMEAVLAQQLRAGRQNVYSDGPQGKQVGRVYAAPTWSENLAGAIRKGIGGLDMRDARRGLENAQMGRREAEAAQGQLDEYRSAEALKQLGVENAAEQQRVAQGQARVDQGQQQIALSQDKNDYQKQRDAVGDKRYLAEQAEEKIQSDLDRQSAESIARIRASEKNKGTKGSELNSATKRRLEMEQSVFPRLNLALNNARELQKKNKDVGKPLGDFVAEKVGNIFGETAGNYATSLVYDEDERAVRRQIDNGVEEYRRAFAGANLTLIERRLSKNWDPTAEGLSTQEKINRVEALMDVINSNREVFDFSLLEKTGSKYDPDNKPPDQSEPGMPKTMSIDEEIRKLEEELGM